MTLAVAHTTTADGTFSATGATEWNRAHSFSGGTASRVLYWSSATVVSDSANFLHDGNGLITVPGLNATSGFSFGNGNVVVLNPATNVMGLYANGYELALTTSLVGTNKDAAVGWSASNSSTVPSTLDTAFSRISAGVIGAGTGAAASVAGQIVAARFNTGDVEGAATSDSQLIKKVTGIADAAATDVLTVTVPNANESAAIRVALVSANGSTDAFESTRIAEGFVVLARTAGANVVAAVTTLAFAQIATVSGGATHTLAWGLSAVSGAAGATNTFTVQATVNDSGNVGSNQIVLVAELINSEATGVTMA